MAALKLIEIIERAKFVRYGDKLVMRYDLSKLESQQDIDKVFNRFIMTVEKMPEKSMLCLLDLRGLGQSRVSGKVMGRTTQRIAPYFKATAILADDEVVIDAIKTLRAELEVYLPLFKEEKPAIEWLRSVEV